MFLRVSSLPCASHVDGNLALRLPLPRPSTRCGVVNPQTKQVVEGWEVGGGWGRLSRCDAASSVLHNLQNLPNLLQLPLRSTCRGRRGGGVRRPRQRSRWRTSRRASDRKSTRLNSSHIAV